MTIRLWGHFVVDGSPMIRDEDCTIIDMLQRTGKTQRDRAAACRPVPSYNCMSNSHQVGTCIFCYTVWESVCISDHPMVLNV